MYSNVIRFVVFHCLCYLQVQSEETGETLRPCVAKSYSFGGYGGVSVLTRGDSVLSTHSAGARLFTKQGKLNLKTLLIACGVMYLFLFNRLCSQFCFLAIKSFKFRVQISVATIRICNTVAHFNTLSIKWFDTTRFVRHGAKCQRSSWCPAGLGCQWYAQCS